MVVTALIVSVLAFIASAVGVVIALRQARAADRSATAAQQSATAAQQSATAAAASDARDADRRADELAERTAVPPRRIAKLLVTAELHPDSRFADVSLKASWTSLRGGTATITITNSTDEPVTVNHLVLTCPAPTGPLSDEYADFPIVAVLPGAQLNRTLRDVAIWAHDTSAGTREHGNAFVELREATDAAGHRWSRDRHGVVTALDQAP